MNRRQLFPRRVLEARPTATRRIVATMSHHFPEDSEHSERSRGELLKPWTSIEQAQRPSASDRTGRADQRFPTSERRRELPSPAGEVNAVKSRSIERVPCRSLPDPEDDARQTPDCSSVQSDGRCRSLPEPMTARLAAMAPSHSPSTPTLHNGSPSRAPSRFARTQKGRTRERIMTRPCEKSPNYLDTVKDTVKKSENFPDFGCHDPGSSTSPLCQTPLTRTKEKS